MTSTPEIPETPSAEAEAVVDAEETIDSAAVESAVEESAADQSASIGSAPAEPVAAEPVAEREADPRLIAAHDLALAALREITPASTIGPAAGHVIEDDGAVSLRFENRLPGYPGWYWTVSLAVVEDSEPTVLEVELLPNEGALLAPEWVPWAERLAEYRAHQAELAEQAATAEAEDADDDDVADDDLDEDDDADLDEDDDADLDEDADLIQPRLHAGDVDGVDIDELDDSADEDDSDDDGDETDSDDESDDDEDSSSEEE